MFRVSELLEKGLAGELWYAFDSSRCQHVLQAFLQTTNSFKHFDICLLFTHALLKHVKTSFQTVYQIGFAYTLIQFDTLRRANKSDIFQIYLDISQIGSNIFLLITYRIAYFEIQHSIRKVRKMIRYLFSSTSSTCSIDMGEIQCQSYESLERHSKNFHRVRII